MALAYGSISNFARVEAVTLVWLVRPVDPVSVALAGTDARYVAVPVERRAFEHGDAVLVVLVVEQTQFHVLGVVGEQREVHAVAVPDRPERERFPRPSLASARAGLAHVEPITVVTVVTDQGSGSGRKVQLVVRRLVDVS